ncbi:MAG: winged helix-turn-helix domain-containing protein [Candidatus Hermodarchaeota archaeon]
MNGERKIIFEGDWDQLIAKHKLRFEIWTILDLYKELNVTQITHYIEYSKSTVARHLKSMEKDGLLESRIGETSVKGRIPPKIYSINPKYKENDIKRDQTDLMGEPEKLINFYKKDINNYRKISYNISQLLDYLDPLLDLLENQLGDIQKAKSTYDEYLSYIDEPVFLYFDKKRARKLMDLRTEYVLKLHKLAMEEELNTEEALVYFDISLPLAALFELKRKIKRARIDEQMIVKLETLIKNAEG